jgi:hypothetical protein
VIQAVLPKPSGAYVYAITVDGVIRYIGKGTGARATEHLRRARRLASDAAARPRARFHRRLADALLGGSKIESLIIAGRLSDDEAYRLEEAEIAKLPLGQLWNIDRGGHGPTSEGMRLAMADPEIRRRISEGTRAGLTEEVLARRRASQIAAFNQPENRLRKRSVSQAKWEDPEYRAAVIAAQSRPEVRRRMSISAKARGGGFTSEGSKALWADPERQHRLSEKRKALWADPEYREKVRVRQKEAMAQPEYRKRMSELHKARHAARRAAQS